MAGTWDTPPTTDELAWAPPTAEELRTAASPTEKPKTGRLVAAGRGVKQGATFGFGDELAGVFGALGAMTTPEGRAKGFRYWYDEARNEDRAKNAAAQEDRPGYYVGGQVGGGLLTVPLLPGAGAARAPTLLGRAGQAAKAGAVYGAVGGAGRADEMGDIPGAAASDAALGAVAGPVLQVAGEGVGAGLGVVRDRVVPRLQSVAVSQGRKHLTGNAAPMATRKELSPEAVQAAYDTKAIRFGGTVEGSAERLQAAREAAGQEYADIIAALEAKGVTGPNASRLAADLLAEANRAKSTTFTTVDPGPGSMQDIAYELLGLQKGMHGVKRVAPKTLTGAAPGGDLPLTVAEDLKRTLQQSAQSEFVKEGPKSLGGESKVKLASRLRQAIEDAVDAQSATAPDEAAAFVPVKRKVGALIEASTAADRAATRAANRQTFGLGSKVLAGGALASGNVPGAVATMLGATALRNRGPAALGWTANSLARTLSASPRVTPGASGVSSEALSDEIRALLEAMRNPRLTLHPGAAEDDRR